MKKVTMQDIADALQISKNSVSQALGNKNGVGEQTKRLVLQKADEMGYKYKKDVVYTPTDNQFALVATEFALSQKSFFGEICLSLEQEMTARGFYLTTLPVTTSDVAENRLPRELEEKNWRGIFILSHISDLFVKQILDLDVPTVMIDHHDPHLRTDTILSQNKDGAFVAVEHLIQLGHTRIGFVGDVDFSPSYEERWEGYCKAMRHYDLPVNTHYTITSIKEEQAALYQALERLEEMPSAWFCVNSGLGFILNSYFQSKGFAIPEQVSIVCFDNTEFAILAQPPLTTMCTDLRFMGKQAVETMEWRLRNPSAPIVNVAIGTELVLRESTGQWQ
ncbi:LacI family DNA-binding transcriptional regulator [Listeria booriae]|uniref:Substrate-binding domain-containing protein n=1 Tax=Listeria booriae TaxID=1552123 RepID=A0A7X0WEJ9_9LIST|nr:LacI family DNA-binding transcriptional regulator [Listeria booriae]MBC1286616.1 substrate-binding domain-containing protein [Listeria booriae]MBC1330944.1 substrate-binding domain-containing protein [Listeria booriae]MBC2319552.1 substrate-binding domain-containing protein [Listeria booriae]MBC2386254.1 substrate-binding domain-containing protein [Listeria booriae]MBC2674358.1 substrate-binding domain-containing protein [Listeria booriae]